MKHVFNIVFFLPLVLAICCMSACDAKIYRDPEVIVLTLSANPPNLNPVLSTEEMAINVEGNIFESLLDMDYDTFELTPLLADRWEASADRLTFTYWLRKDVRWHDGKPFTADDVVYTFKAIKDPKVDAARLRGYLKDIKSIEKLDDYTVRFVYSRLYFKAPQIIGSVNIIPKHIFDDGTDFNTHKMSRVPIGTGSYKFDYWQGGQKIVLSKFDGYWGKHPAVKGIVFKIIADSTASFAMLKKAAVDQGNLTAIQWARQLNERPFKEYFNKYHYYLPNYSYINWNNRRPYFSDRRVRIALTMLIDRQRILEKLLLGEGEVVSGPFYKFGLNYDQSIKPYPYDPQAARELLSEAGWIDHDGDGILDKDGEPFKFTLLTAAGSAFARTMGIFLKDEFSRVGISMEVVQTEWAFFLNKLAKRDFDASISAFGIGFFEDAYSIFHSSTAESGFNYAGFMNAKADKILEDARQEFDAKKRVKLYKQLHMILHEEQPCSFLFTFPTRVVLAKRFSNIVVHKAGLKFIDWKIEPWPALLEW